MNRLALNNVVRTVRVNSTTRSVVPSRWQSSQSANQQTSPYVAGAAGGLAVLLGGYAWYHFSGTRKVVNTANTALNQAEELKKKVKETAGDPAESAANTLAYLRSATTTLIPGSAPFLGKVFDQIEQVSKDHGDEVKKIFDETYKDFEKLTKDGALDSKTASKAVEILQKRVNQIQEIAGEVSGNAYNKLIADYPDLKDKISDQYNKLKEFVEKAKDKKPEIEKMLADVGSELVNIFKDKGVNKETIKEAQELLKKKLEEAKKLGEDTLKEGSKKSDKDGSKKSGDDGDKGGSKKSDKDGSKKSGEDGDKGSSKKSGDDGDKGGSKKPDGDHGKEGSKKSDKDGSKKSGDEKGKDDSKKSGGDGGKEGSKK